MSTALKHDRPAVLAAVARIKGSAVMARGGRMNRLLGYLVEAALDGRAEAFGQRAIAAEVFGRDERFDPASDAIVRAEIGRLRAKLAEYYSGEGAEDSLAIELPRGGYRVRFVTRGDAAPTGSDLPSHRIRYCRADDGASIAYSEAGSGYPLFLLPTWMSHLESDLRNPMLRHYWLEFTKRYRVIRFDCRGFGLSDRSVPDLDLKTIVSDLHLVANALDVERFALFGPSGGAFLGTAYAAAHPERVSHLVLLGGFLRGARTVDDPQAHAYADAIDAAIRAGWGRPDSLFRQIFTRVLVPEATPEQHALLDKAQLDAATGEMAYRWHRLISETDLTEAARRVRAPTLVFHGTEEFTPFSEAQHAAATIPDARLIPLPTANHILLESEPAWQTVLNELDRFIPDA